MKSWTELILPFTVGVAVGLGLSFLVFASRLRFYKEFIERRLASINRFRGLAGARQKSPKAPHWKAFLTRRSKPGKESTRTQDE